MLRNFDIINIRPYGSDTNIVLFDAFWNVLGDIPNVRGTRVHLFRFQ